MRGNPLPGAQFELVLEVLVVGEEGGARKFTKQEVFEVVRSVFSLGVAELAKIDVLADQAVVESSDYGVQVTAETFGLIRMNPVLDVVLIEKIQEVLLLSGTGNRSTFAASKFIVFGDSESASQVK